MLTHSFQILKCQHFSRIITKDAFSEVHSKCLTLHPFKMHYYFHQANKLSRFFFLPYLSLDMRSLTVSKHTSRETFNSRISLRPEKTGLWCNFTCLFVTQRFKWHTLGKHPIWVLKAAWLLILDPLCHFYFSAHHWQQFDYDWPALTELSGALHLRRILIFRKSPSGVTYSCQRTPEENHSSSFYNKYVM